MKALEFIFQDTQIHFLLGNDKNVMVNATEMAKAFGKETRVFLKTDHAKAFIEELKCAPFGAHFNNLQEHEILDNRQRAANQFASSAFIKFREAMQWLKVVRSQIWQKACPRLIGLRIYGIQ